jgi:transposase-like protein
MTDNDELLGCPRCGFSDVPTLIVDDGRKTEGGFRWRCRSCQCDWTDEQYRWLWAS